MAPRCRPAKRNGAFWFAAAFAFKLVETAPAAVSQTIVNRATNSLARLDGPVRTAVCSGVEAERVTCALGICVGRSAVCRLPVPGDTPVWRKCECKHASAPGFLCSRRREWKCHDLWVNPNVPSISHGYTSRSFTRYSIERPRRDEGALNCYQRKLQHILSFTKSLWRFFFSRLLKD